MCQVFSSKSFSMNPQICLALLIAVYCVPKFGLKRSKHFLECKDILSPVPLGIYTSLTSETITSNKVM